MGESIVEAPVVENKMGESVASTASLESSVSFGRFDGDSLSWEKWSSFSPNKYLEEVEKCSAPGSVAQKKAFFEAHYKMIAARKAEQLEQDNAMESSSPRSHDSERENHIETTSGNESEFSVFNGEKSNEKLGQEAAVDNTTVDDIGEDNDVIEGESHNILIKEVEEELRSSQSVAEGSLANDSTVEDFREEKDVIPGVCTLINEVEEELRSSQSVAEGSLANKASVDDIGEEKDVLAGVCHNILIKEVEGEVNGSLSGYTEYTEGEKAVLVEEEHTCQKIPPDVLQQDCKVHIKTKRASESVMKNSKAKGRNIIEKKTPTKKEQPLVGTKKKVVSSAAKSSPVSAPKSSKLAPSSPLISASKSSCKKLNGTLLPRNNNTTLVGENKRAGPTSVHMSLNLGPSNPSVTTASIRKSLIMEQMADKDIIKRAFKTFQKNYSELRSSYDDKLNEVNQVSSNVPERKLTTSLTPRKENKGMRKAAEKNISPQRGQFGSKFSSPSPGLGSSVDKNNQKSVSPSVGVASEKRREFLKKLEQKSIVREEEKAHVRAKSKEKDGEMRKLKQNSKTPVQTYSKGGVSKSLLQKDVVKKNIRTR